MGASATLLWLGMTGTTRVAVAAAVAAGARVGANIGREEEARLLLRTGEDECGISIFIAFIFYFPTTGVW